MAISEFPEWLYSGNGDKSGLLGPLEIRKSCDFDYFLTNFIGKKYQNSLKKSRHVSKSAF